MGLEERLKSLGLWVKFLNNCLNDRDYKKDKYEDYSYMCISTAFIFHNTPEGVDFWYTVGTVTNGYVMPKDRLLKALHNHINYKNSKKPSIFRSN